MKPLNYSAAQDIADRARQNGCSPAKQAIYENVSPDFHMWPVPKEINENEDSGDYSAVQLISEDDTPRKNDVVSRMARAIAKEIQFPVNTAYMHAVGCVASAMTPRFSVAYHGDELPVCLYIATSQPPSSGKSAINNKLMKPVSREFEQLNKKNWKERRRLLAKIAELEDSIKKEGKGAPREAIEAQEMEIADLTDKLMHWPVFTYPVTDATPEALAKIAAQENGIFNLISDEASALNTVLGLTYKTDGKANSELVLKAWDGGRISSRRASGDNLTFDARGNVCVIAQDEVIDAILQAGERGNGLTERFLIVREAHKMGTRIFIDDDGEMIDRSAPPDVIAAYAGLVHNLVSCDTNIVFKLSRQAEKCMNIRRQVMEESFCDNGKWSHPLLRGAMGKMDKQVYKLASVLHASKHWCAGGDKSTVIDDETITSALSLYDGIAQTFVDATSSQGYAGENSEMNAIIARMAKYYESKRTMTNVRALYQDLRKVKPFKGVTGLQKRLEDKLMPELEEKGYCVVRDKYIYINPKITGR